MPGFKLMAQLGLDGTGFAAGFRQARGIAAGMAEELKAFAIEAIGVVTVGEAIRRTVESAKELVETSERLAIAPEQLQIMRQAAKQTGAEFDDLAAALEKVNIARQRALIPGREGQSARRAFSAMGIGVGDLRNQTGAELLLGPIRQAVLNRNPDELGIIFRELGVKAFGKLIPFLKTDFDELSAKMKKMGAIMDTETAVKLKALAEEFSLLSQIIASQLGPALVKFAEVAYMAALKLGGGIAKGGTFLGAMVGSQGSLGFFTSLVSAIGHTVAHTLGFLSDKDFDQKMRALIPKAAVEGQDNGDEFWIQKQKEFAEFLDHLKDKAKELDNPIPTNLDEHLQPKMTKKALETPTDSLIRIGNFLGSGQNAIVAVNQRKIQLLQQIANNTKGQPARNMPTKFVGDVEPTFFPIG